MSVTGVGVSGLSVEMLGRGVGSGVGVLGEGQCLRGEGCSVQGRCLGVLGGTPLRLGWESAAAGVGEGASAWEKGCRVPRVVCGEGTVREWAWTGIALRWVGSVGVERVERGGGRVRVIVDRVVLGKGVK